MTIALWLLAIQGATGAFDTAYYHEWRARLPARPATAAAAVPDPLRLTLAIMSAGVFLSGARDLYAASGLPHGGWPWTIA